MEAASEGVGVRVGTKRSTEVPQLLMPSHLSDTFSAFVELLGRLFRCRELGGFLTRGCAVGQPL